MPGSVIPLPEDAAVPPHVPFDWRDVAAHQCGVSIRSMRRPMPWPPVIDTTS